MLEKVATAKIFELVFELSWKTLKDLLDKEGRPAELMTPRSVIKQAFAVGLLPEGRIWIDMIEQRNRLSHVYDSEVLSEVMADMETPYRPAIDALHARLLTRRGR